MNGAVIKDGKVNNIVVFTLRSLESLPNVVLIPDGVAVHIGDEYQSGRFYHAGKINEPYCPNEESEKKSQAENRQIQQRLTELDIQNIALQQQFTELDLRIQEVTMLGVE